jgi:hypothetical protein
VPPANIVVELRAAVASFLANLRALRLHPG